MLLEQKFHITSKMKKEKKKLMFLSEVYHTSFIYEFAYYLATKNLKFILNIILMLRNVKKLEKVWEEIKKDYPNIEKHMGELIKKTNIIEELRKTIGAESTKDRNKYDKMLINIYKITPVYVFETMDAFWRLIRKTELINARISNELVELAQKEELSLKRTERESGKGYFEE